MSRDPWAAADTDARHALSRVIRQARGAATPFGWSAQEIKSPAGGELAGVLAVMGTDGRPCATPPSCDPIANDRLILLCRSQERPATVKPSLLSPSWLSGTRVPRMGSDEALGRDLGD